MLKSVRLQNFFSFQDETIELNSGVNILVGINGSGKSNFLKAIQLLREVANRNDLKKLIINSWGGFDAIACNNQVNKNIDDIENISITFSFDPKAFSFIDEIDSFTYSIEIVKAESNSTRYFLNEIIDVGNAAVSVLNIISVFSGIVNYSVFSTKRPAERITDHDEQNSVLFQVQWTDRVVPHFLYRINQELELYRLFNTSLFAPIRKPVFATADKRLNIDGDNLINVLNYMKGERLSSYNQLIAKLREINENFIGFDYSFLGGSVSLSLQEKNLERPTGIIHISDGTLVYICLLTILCNPDRGKTICIDEPETGLHPDMVRGICKAIREASVTSQLIIPTHSAQLLDNFEIEDIIVFEKDENNSTKAKRFTKEDFKGWYDNFYPGQMWLSGNLGGVRW